MKWPSLVIVLSLLLVSACGGSNPLAPSPSVPNYAGNWSGSYVLSGCNQSGGMALANFCANLGATMPYGLALTQSGSNVSGSFSLGQITFSSTGGTVSGDGSLTLNGSTVSNGNTIIVTWALRLSGSALSGTLTQVWTSSTLSGQINMVGTISTAVR